MTSYPVSGRTIIATSSRAHLDQLRTDLEHHVPSSDWAALKGHQTYWCVDAEVLTELRRLHPHYAAQLEQWRGHTKHGELRDELPDIPASVLDLVTCPADECRDADCCYRPAREHANDAKVILTTHANVMTRYRYNRPLLGVDALIVDECHLLEQTATNDALPMSDVRDCLNIRDAGRWWQGIQDAIHSSHRTWISARDSTTKLLEPTSKRLGKSAIEIAKEVKGTPKRDRAGLGLTGDEIARALELAKALRAIALLDRAIITAGKTKSTGRGRLATKNKDAVAMALSEPHHEYLDIQDARLCLRASDPMVEVTNLVDHYRTTILTSATISRAPVEITRYGTPFDLVEQIQIKVLPDNCPPRPKWGNDDAEQLRAEFLAAGLAKLAGQNRHVIALVTSKSHANRLASLLPGSHVERTGYGADKCAAAIREHGGIMIAYSWHGFDLPSSSKALLLERMPWAAPSRAWAALAAVTSIDTAAQRADADLRQRIHQGYGRAIRSADDRCTVIRGEDAMRQFGDPRRLAPYEAA
jgi:Rad3-related DNA helicase